jgi:hypothetical protein
VCGTAPWILLVSAHRSDHQVLDTPPPRVLYDSDHPFISYDDLLEGRKLGIADHHYLCILIQVLVRFYQEVIDADTDLYKTPYPYCILPRPPRASCETPTLPTFPTNHRRPEQNTFPYYGPVICLCEPHYHPLQTPLDPLHLI